MAFIIENGTAGIVEIEDLGITLGIGEITDLSTRTEPQNVALTMEAGEELFNLITAGDVIVKDPLDGVTNLSVADGIVCLQAINDPHFRVGAGARIGDISDVDLTGLSDNFILEFDTASGDWLATLNTGGTGISRAISDVNADSGSFAAVAEDSFDIIGGTGITTSISGDILTIVNDAPDQNLWATIVADTGSTTADSVTDTLSILGSSPINTAISGDTLTINIGNGLDGLEISTLDGQPMLTFVDSTRSNKRLSVETIPLMWSDGSIRREDWIPIGRSSGEGNGYSVPHQGTIVKVTADSLHNNGVSRHIDLYMNKILNTASLVTFTGIPNGPEKFEDVTLDIDFTVANVLQLRADATGTAGVSLEDCVLVLWIKWRI